ncbi:hypothetical protein ACJRO7_033623 [Eucalyptus globulus]|uniref:Beta-Casp domain-containing protein n=1 Tax=Eucalyptus globulus TaxID=34317 RepID=A0ABD3JUE5_EUCGL
MKLSEVKGFYSPPRHMLSVCGFRILIDCPLDLSALAVFAPKPPGFSIDESDGCESGNEERENTEKPMTAKALIRSKPWYKPVANLHLWNPSFINGELESRPSALKEIVLGSDGIELGGWIPLYRVPINAADIEDCVKKVQRLEYAEVACYNGTLSIKPISSGLEVGVCNWTIRYPDGMIGFFNYNALRLCDVLIYSDFSSLDNLETANKGSNYTTLEDSSTSRYHVFFIYCDETNDLEELLLHADESSEEMEKLNFICSCAVDACWYLRKCVFDMYASECFVPIFVIWSVAEELLAYTNIIPEWVCKQRQEKLFSGEPLFAHAELLNGERLQVYPAIYSPKLFFRLGPAVHLLRRWHGDEKSLLIWEDGMDSDIALLPFDPKLNYSTGPIALHSCMYINYKNIMLAHFISRIDLTCQLKKVQPLIHVLQPKFVVTLKLPTLKEDLELEITADLISQLRWKNLNDQNLSITRVKGNLVMRETRRRILPSSEPSCSKSEPPLLWGAPDLQWLLGCLSEMGIGGSLQEDSVTDGSSDACIVCIDTPSEALLEIRSTSTLISAANEELAFLIRDAVDSILDGT